MELAIGPDEVALYLSLFFFSRSNLTFDFRLLQQRREGGESLGLLIFFFMHSKGCLEIGCKNEGLACRENENKRQKKRKMCETKKEMMVDLG